MCPHTFGTKSHAHRIVTFLQILPSPPLTFFLPRRLCLSPHWEANCSYRILLFLSYKLRPSIHPSSHLLQDVNSYTRNNIAFVMSRRPGGVSSVNLKRLKNYSFLTRIDEGKPESEHLFQMFSETCHFSRGMKFCRSHEVRRLTPSSEIAPWFRRSTSRGVRRQHLSALADKTGTDRALTRETLG